MMRIKLNDTVVVISGKDKGKKGKVIEISTKKESVKVQGVNIKTRHAKARRQGESSTIKKQEAFIHMAKVMPLCPTTNKPCRVNVVTSQTGEATRVSNRSKQAL